MATIGGLTTSTSSSIRGYGGLASGLDRDTLIEGMTYGTTSKITQQTQKKTQMEWKQAAVQSISDLMIAFANRYTESLTSSNNLFSSIFWGRTNISTTGTNSKYVSVTGNASTAESISILGVKQLAEQAKWSSSSQVSDQTLTMGEITDEMVAKDYSVYNLAGKTLELKNGTDAVTITFNEPEKYDYTTAQGIADAINDQLKEKTWSESRTGKLSEYINVTVDGDQLKFNTLKTDGNKQRIAGGSAAGLLGIEGEKDDDGWMLEDGKSVAGTADKDKLGAKIDFDQKIAGKQLTFSYNGTSANVYMPVLEELQKVANKDENGDPISGAAQAKLDVIKDSLQSQLNAAFGKGRIRVDSTGGKLSFTTMDPSKDPNTDPNGGKDSTSTFTLVSGSQDLIGGGSEAVLGVLAGESNRVNLNTSLKDSGLKLDGVTFEEEFQTDKDGNFVLDENNQKISTGRRKATFQLNEVSIDVYEDESMSSLMNRINSSGAGVKLTYQSAADKFTFTSTENGASGAVNLSGNKALLQGLFGVEKKAGDTGNTITEDGDNISVNLRGKDAIVAVKYAGSDEPIELIRDTNSFTVDGLAIGLKGTFGYEAGELKNDPAEEVGIDARVNVDNIVDNIKSMVEEYNAIVDLVNKELTTKPDREYSPLTSEQKKELSEDEIKLYEEKAKMGMLYGDSDLRSLSSDLRFVISGGNAEALREIGITTSTIYSDNGKLSLDEGKLRAMLETNPEKVEEAFTRDNGNSSYNGIATNLKSVMDKYVKTMGSWDRKGVLIKKAGHSSSPVSVSENYMYKQILEINKQIAKLQTRLETERDRYIKQFTSLETLISQMNSQSSYLSQIGGY